VSQEQAGDRLDERFRALVTATSDVVYSMSPDWSEMRHLAGRDFIADTTAPSRGWLDKYIHPDDQPRVLEAIAHAVRTKGVFELEHRVVRPDGTLGWTLSRAIPVLDARGEVVEWFGAASDTTHRRQAESALVEARSDAERQRRLYEAILGNTPDLAYVWNLEHRFIYANEGLLRMWGKTWDEAIGKNCLELGYEPWHAAMHDREIEQVVATGKPVRGEVPFSGTFGRRIYDYILVPVVGPDGKVEAVAGTTRDVTDYRDIQQRKDEFIAMLSHELRNPLAPLRTALHLLRSGASGADPAPVHAVMERQLDHLVRLVDDLLEVSRISRGALELRKEPVDIASVARNALETSAPAIRAGEHRLTVSMPGEPLWVEADPVRLAQVLANLLNNAAHYTPRGGAIALEAAREGAVAVVRVCDNGAGIPSERLPAIFEMFTRGEGAQALAPKGLGIGLALARGLVQMHGGTIDAQSDGPGRGSAFTVRLPLIEPPAQSDRAAPTPVALAGRRILVIDDNLDAAQTLAQVLQILGAEVRVADSGTAGLDAYRAYRPEVVLLDIGMPGMDGYEVARRIRADEPAGSRASLVALTGWGQDEQRQKAREAGFDHHLVKPAEIAALQALLGSLPQRRSAR
jgi:PAS domain S-box-containing protein